jgi:hypothetical protein
VLEPISDDIADQLGGVHALRQRADDVITLRGAHALGDVAEDGGEDLDRHQGADLGQLGHLWTDDQHVEEIA